MPAVGFLQGGHLGPIAGGIAGAISPPAGLNNWQGFLHGFASGFPAWRLLGTGYHALTGTLNQWGDPANNPYTLAQTPTTPEAPWTPPAPLPGTSDYGQPNTIAPDANQQQPQASAIAKILQAIPANNIGFNATRAPFGPTSFQVNNPGSAIGPGGFSLNSGPLGWSPQNPFANQLSYGGGNFGSGILGQIQLRNLP